MSPKLITNKETEDRRKINDNFKECWEILKAELEKRKELKKTIKSSKNIWQIQK